MTGVQTCALPISSLVLPVSVIMSDTLSFIICEFIRAYLDSQELTAEDLKAIRELVEKKQQEVK